jgi:hypothetical protein
MEQVIEKDSLINIMLEVGITNYWQHRLLENRFHRNSFTLIIFPESQLKRKIKYISMIVKFD